MSSKDLTIKITVIRGESLLAADINGKSDPYVVLKWRDADKKSKQKTKVIHKNLNPRWDQTFTFPYSKNCTVLELSVWDKDTIGKMTFLDMLKFHCWK